MNHRRRSFLWVNLLLALGAACFTGWAIYQNYDGMSFGGFGSLFAIALLTPSFCALALDVLLLTLAIKGQRFYATIAFWLQILSGIPYTWLLYLDPVLFSIFAAHAVLLLLGIAALIGRARQR